MIELVDVYNVHQAVDILWDLLVERSIETDTFTNISHCALPSRDEHDAFVAKRPFYRWYLVKTHDGWAGYVSVTYRNEIGIVLFKKHRGHGIGKAAVIDLIRDVSPLPAIPSERQGRFVANINPRNEQSIRMFRGMGFQHIQNTYAIG